MAMMPMREEGECYEFPPQLGDDEGQNAADAGPWRVLCEVAQLPNCTTSGSLSWSPLGKALAPDELPPPNSAILSYHHHHRLSRLEICRDRRDRRSCKIFPSCVKFWGNNANSLGNYRAIYALNE